MISDGIDKPLLSFIAAYKRKILRMERSTLIQCTTHSVSETDRESDSKVTLRQRKKRYSSELKLESTIMKFKSDLTDHITNLFSDFKKDQDEKFSLLKTGIESLSDEITQIKTSNAETVNKVNTITNTCETMSLNTQKLEKKSEILENRIVQLEKGVMFVQNEIAEYKIEIKNIPSLGIEGQVELTQLVQRICGKFGIELTPSDFRNIYRLKGKKSTPIIVEFTTTELKQRIIIGLKNYNKTNDKNKLNTGDLGIEGQVKPIYISEYLTNFAKTLFFLSREFAKKYNYAYCWTAYGNIFLRKEDGAKRIQVDCADTLRKLIPEQVSLPKTKD